MNNIDISICIPTYNRAPQLVQCINNVLQCKSNNIEVVVSDNHSTDNSEIEIGKIKDTRLKYFKNNENLGFDANILKLIEHACGTFLYFLSDEDSINPDSLDWILKKLSNNNLEGISQVLGSIGDTRKGYKDLYWRYGDKYLKRGDESISQILFQNSYMSGIVLRRASLDENHAKQYIGFSYMMQVLQAQSMISGATICSSKTFSYIGDTQVNNIFMMKGDIKGKTHFHPESKAFQILQRIKLIKELNLGKKTLRRMLNEQKKRAALLIERTVRIESKHFSKTFSTLIKSKELTYSFMFWLYVFLAFPLVFITNKNKHTYTHSKYNKYNT